MKQMLPALLVLVFFHASVQAVDKIRITVSGLSGQFMTFPLAQKRGFLKEEGLDAEIIRITGAASRAALSSGEADYGTGLGSNIGLAMTGLPIKVVACYVPLNTKDTKKRGLTTKARRTRRTSSRKLTTKGTKNT